MLQCVAVCCSVLQCVIACFSMLQFFCVGAVMAKGLGLRVECERENIFERKTAAVIAGEH